MDKTDIDIRIREAELQRIKADEKKIISEKAKIDTERQELEKPFYKKFQFIQTLIAGVLGGLAFLGVLTKVIEPSYKRDIIQKELQIAKQEKDLYELENTNRNILDSINLIKDDNDKLLSEIIIQKKKSINIVNEHLNNLIENTKSEGLLIATIYFEYDKAIIQEEFVRYLGKLSKFLINNSNIKIMVRGYSFEKGTEAYNLMLSQKRAEVVTRKLIQNGVNPERLISHGMGESPFYKDVLKNLDEELEKKTI